MQGGRVSVRPRFIGANDEIFVVQYSPSAPPRGHVIYMPPFGEEMNRCRAVAARQARRFAQAGYLCTIMDYQGTGESRGSLEDATADQWRRDAATVAETVAETESGQHMPLILWGCRLGALLALYVAQDLDATAVILWQPVSLGKTYLTQFLRQRAAALLAQGLPGENTGAIREAILSGKTIEVAGYPLASPLVESIDQLDVKSLTSLRGTSVYWLENVSEEAAPLAPRVQKDVERLQAADARVEVIPFVGNALWQLHERADCPQLNARTPTEFAS